MHPPRSTLRASPTDPDERVLRIATATAAAGFPGVGPAPPHNAAAATAGNTSGVTSSPPDAATAAGDVVSLLTGVFGSPEVFIAEYRNLLAGQLLTRSDYDTVRGLWGTVPVCRKTCVRNMLSHDSASHTAG